MLTHSGTTYTLIARNHRHREASLLSALSSTQQQKTKQYIVEPNSPKNVFKKACTKHAHVNMSMSPPARVLLTTWGKSSTYGARTLTSPSKQRARCSGTVARSPHADRRKRITPSRHPTHPGRSRNGTMMLDKRGRWGGASWKTNIKLCCSDDYLGNGTIIPGGRRGP